MYRGFVLAAVALGSNLGLGPFAASHSLSLSHPVSCRNHKHTSQYLISLLYMLENMWADVGEVKMCLMCTISSQCSVFEEVILGAKMSRPACLRAKSEALVKVLCKTRFCVSENTVHIQGKTQHSQFVSNKGHPGDRLNSCGSVLKLPVGKVVEEYGENRGSDQSEAA